MTDSYEAKKNSGGAPRKISSEDEKKPDLTLEEIKEQGNLEARLNGKTESLVYKNSLTGDFFKQWVKEALCP